MIINSEKIEEIIKNSTYKVLADYSGVSPSTAKQWKTGEKDWRKSKFESIEKLYTSYIEFSEGNHED
nr:MAG TPA: helix-turn-helix domain protein [Caudoviricetes sp.]